MSCACYASSEQYQDYDNARFGFHVSYPPEFKPQGESENADGQKFANDSGAALTTYAYYRIDGNNIKDVYKNEVDGSGIKITYKVLKKNWFVISGTKDGEIIYEKVIQNDDTLAHMSFSYPESKAGDYSQITKMISDGFKFLQAK